LRRDFSFNVIFTKPIQDREVEVVVSFFIDRMESFQKEQVCSEVVLSSVN
jgi:hypothetical protein